MLTRGFRWTHRWLAIVLGILLLAITTSGCVLLYRGELFKLFNPQLFDATETSREIGLEEAIAAADSRYPKFEASGAMRTQGVYQVHNDLGEQVNVDPGTGEVLGRYNPQRGFLGFTTNLHDCLLSCEGYSGYVGFLNKPMPGLGIPGLDKLMIGPFLLGVMALVLLYLCVTGLVLWWPGLRRWRRGFQVRWQKGRYSRDFDLHQVIGFAALPFLLIWAGSGAFFELPVVSKVWYGLLPGTEPAEASYEFASKPGKGPDISFRQAERAATAETGGDGKLVGAFIPAEGDKTGYYELYFSRPFDTWAHYAYPGNFIVSVDRRDASRRKVTWGWSGRPLSQQLADDWSYTLHFGTPVSGWPRLIWLAFGITPLILAFTALSTWFWKLGRKREKRRRRASPVPT